jgi:hypothetical protein
VASFSVTSVNESTTIDAAGQLVNQVTVTLKTTRGARGSVTFTTDQFEAFTSSDEGKAALQSILAQKADQLDAPFSM